MQRKFRITRSADFKRVRRFGKSFAHPLVIVVASEGETEHPRAGIITTRSIGKAVQRNRVKRQIRELMTPILPSLNTKVDLLVIARAPTRDASFQEIRDAILILLERANLVVSSDH